MKRLLRLLLGILMILTCVFIWLDISNSQKDTPFSVTIDMAGGVEEFFPWKNVDGEWYVFLPSYADLSNVRLNFNICNKIYVNNCEVSDGTLFGNGCHYGQNNLTICYGEAQSTYSLIIVKSNNVAALCIDTESGNSIRINTDKDIEESGNLRLYSQTGEMNYCGKVESFKGRGNSTWIDFDKKPYSLELHEKANLLDMGSAKKWVLLANAYDATNMRNKIIYEFANSFGMQYTPDSRWVDLYLNGEYNGLYLLCEKNEVDAERVAISEEGSFLISSEMESNLKEKEQRYFLTDAGQALKIHFLDETVEVERIIQDIENVLINPDGVDTITGKKWTELIDLESWVKKYLIEEFFANIDGCSKSQFYYYDGKENSNKVYAGPVWDYDGSIGNEVPWQIPLVNIFYANRSMVREGETLPWFSSLYKKEEFYERAVQIYKDELLPLINRYLSIVIPDYSAFISQASQMNELRWGHENTFEDSVNSMISFIESRIGFLSNLWLSGKSFHLVTVYSKNDKHNIYIPVEDGTCLMQLPDLPDKQNRQFLGWYYVDSDETIDYTDIITQDVEIYAKWKENDTNTNYNKIVPGFIALVIGCAVFLSDLRRMRKGG